MIILFAPSESKCEGGNLPPLNNESLILPELYSKRLEVIREYEKLVQESNEQQLYDIFGLKDSKTYVRYKQPFCNLPTMKAIERYDGVAYDYLNYTTLSSEQQQYLDINVILFSNLFGPIRAGDSLPDYKLKQGAAIGSFAPEKFYKEHFSVALDTLIGEEEVLDLRAGFYDKFYVPKNFVTTLKFLKEGKVVSHWAKAYRGIVLRQIALHHIDSLAALTAINIEGLVLHEIIETKQKKEIIYTII